MHSMIHVWMQNSTPQILLFTVTASSVRYSKHDRLNRDLLPLLGPAASRRLLHLLQLHLGPVVVCPDGSRFVLHLRGGAYADIQQQGTINQQRTARTRGKGAIQAINSYL